MDVTTLEIAKPGVLPRKYNCCELVRREIPGLGTAHRAANWDRQEQPEREKTHSGCGSG